MGQASPDFALLRLSPVARYALSAASHLALQTEGSVSGVEGIAGGRRLPRSYLSKILRQLARRGLVTSRRGRTGGHRLARPASDISLAEILRAVEIPHIGHRRCLLELRGCGQGSPCVIHHLAVIAENRIWTALERTTLAAYARGLERIRI